MADKEVNELPAVTSAANSDLFMVEASSVLSSITKTYLSSTLSISTAVNGVAAGYKIARGRHTTIDENDTVVTGLATVVVVVAQLDSDPVDGCMHVTAAIGDQAGAPAAGSIFIKTWKSTDGDASLVPATTFSKVVGWIAVGT